MYAILNKRYIQIPRICKLKLGEGGEFQYPF